MAAETPALDDGECDRLRALMREWAAEIDADGTVAGFGREDLGRIVHDVRLASEAERAEAEGRHRFNLSGWEERTDHQRELDMRIAEAVARAATAEYENAITWGTSCTSCSRVLDSAAAERERAEDAEAKLAEVRSVLLEGGQGDATARCRAIAIVGDGQERSDEKEADHG